MNAQRGVVAELVNGQYGVFVNDGTRHQILVCVRDSRLEADAEAVRVRPRSHFAVLPDRCGWTLIEVRISETGQRHYKARPCATEAELHRHRRNAVARGYHEIHELTKKQRRRLRKAAEASAIFA